MKPIDIGEFIDKANHYLDNDESVDINRDGKRLGLYVPIWKKYRNSHKKDPAQMKYIDIEEFTANATHYMTSPENFAIERDGVVLGHYLKSKDKDTPEVKQLNERMNQVLERIYEQTGLDEEGFIEFLGLNQPLR